MKERLKKIKKVILDAINTKINLKHISYSQCGEDLIVDFIFTQLNIKNFKYLDLGTHHPIYINNTFLFYKKGLTGVCVEPDLSLYRKIKGKRKNDVCLNIGVGIKNEITDFFILSSKSLSTFSKEDAIRISLNKTHNIEKIIQVELKTISTILSENFINTYPNFVSIDIEGLDYLILQTFDFTKYRPEVFCIETLTYTENASEEKISEITKFMEKKGYFVYADTYINTIYVEKKSWEKRYEKNN
jgi:FkbM family methyltransferase